MKWCSIIHKTSDKMQIAAAASGDAACTAEAIGQAVLMLTAFNKVLLL